MVRMNSLSFMNVIKKLLYLLLSKAKGSLQWLLLLFSKLTRLYNIDAHKKPRKKTCDDEATDKGRNTSSIRSTLVASVVPSPLYKEEQITPFSTVAPSTTYKAPSHPYSRPRPNLDLGSYPYSPSLPRVEENGDHEPAVMSPGRMTAEPESIIVLYPSPLTITPSERPRYDREIEIKSKSAPIKFDPIGTFISCRDQGNDFWEYNVHPEGLPYYKHTGRFTYLTEAHVGNMNSQMHMRLLQCIQYIEVEADKFRNGDDKLMVADNGGTIEDEDVEVVIEVDDKIKWSYYMVDMKRRNIFWLEGYEFPEGHGVERKQQLCHMLEFEFWQHIEHFPNRSPMDGLLEQIMGELNYMKIDVITSADTTAPYSEGDFSSLISSFKHLHSLRNSQTASAYVVVCCARIMAVIANERHCNFYGFNGARLSATQSVRESQKKERSWLVRIMSPLLFYAPETHLKNLERLFVDGVIKDRRWKSFQSKLERDWEGFVLTSTVLLNANVAILSVPIVISDQNSWASPAAIASQVSIVVSLGSIIIGLLLVRQIRISAKNDEYTATDAMTYLTRREHEQLGLETMAIQYSLPYALLMWGMVTFLAAIAIASFLKMPGQPLNLVRGIFAFAWIFILPLIVWTVITGWETTQKMHWKEIAVVRWWHAASSKVKSLGGYKKGENGDVESGSITELPPLNEEIESESSSQDGKKARRPSWRPRFRVPGPVRRLTSNYF